MLSVISGSQDQSRIAASMIKRRDPLTFSPSGPLAFPRVMAR